MFTVESFIEDCRTAVTADPGPLAVRDCVAEAVSQPEEILAALGEPTDAGFQPL